MHRSLAAVAIVAGMFGATQLSNAADLPTKAPAYVPAPAPIAYNWNGFYVGVHVGYGWGTSDADHFSSNTGAFIDSTSEDRKGIFGGGQIGFNYMVMPNWLIGVEADLSAADITGSTDACGGLGCVHSETKIDWLGTARGRTGYVWNNVLLYGTGGAAWRHASTDRTFTTGALTGQTASSSGTALGWTAGGGIEWGFMPNWTVKAEYLYMDIKGSADFIGYTNTVANRHSESELKLNTFKVGLNYLFNWMH